jgi:hypothetical protein
LRRASTNFQERATEFSVGDKVAPFGLMDAQAGRVVAVWPAIGMVDVEFPTGNRRFPVEELQIFDDRGNSVPSSLNSQVPGGVGTVSVPGGPSVPSAHRVADAYGKQALYWAGQDRKYRMTRSEAGANCPNCPRCGEGHPLRKAIYKRRGGNNERLMGCPGCMFLIKAEDIIINSQVSELEVEK